MGRVITFSRNVFIPLTSVCRNRCDYCGFRTPVREGSILQPGQVQRILNHGASLHCTEALFTFGERPELEPGFTALLSSLGYGSIIDYCYEMCGKALAAGLLPHTNAGILSYGEMDRLREVNASMGLMLETTAEVPAHRNSPGKRPGERLRMMEDAGKLRIPFTTGILVGIGETMGDREESFMAIRDLHRRYGHIQEVIVQNFCPKEGTPMAGSPVPSMEEMCLTIQVARDILPPDIAIQVAPNLADAAALIPCGVDDLGGVSPVTPDYINPEHPWPAVEELRRVARDATLRERLCIYPQFIRQGWYHPSIEALIRRLEQQIRGDTR
ncbi:MAG TPA: 7,8-didemethyl-8-hydroxy-5-deazariboflavin synthase CofG [Methanomicrobiales archaeon]|nr:7,8-didemethyl-8-hydroxy-5-deazariboflavin synthase CofG [Methanomicrobiales archaeon]